ncbi:MAG: hypothetical protein WBA44_17485 [Mesorhizobium sp.]
MSLGYTFNYTGGEQAYVPGPTKPKAKRLAPFSIRLSEDERARLAMEAAGAPLGAYIKAKALGVPVRARRTGLAVEDRVALAKGLALLGQSRLASNLNQFAYAVNIGSLPVTPETEEELFAALRDVRELRRLFLTALGLKPEDAP